MEEFIMKIVKYHDSRTNSLDYICEVSEYDEDNESAAMKCLGTLLPLVKQGKAVGIACNQIGITYCRVFLAVINRKIRTFVNPTIIKHSSEQIDIYESCLSIPNIEIKAPRYKWVVIEYRTTDTPEASQHERFEGFDAQIIQHEIDHLNGITLKEYEFIEEEDKPKEEEKEKKDDRKVKDSTSKPKKTKRANRKKSKKARK